MFSKKVFTRTKISALVFFQMRVLDALGADIIVFFFLKTLSHPQNMGAQSCSRLDINNYLDVFTAFFGGVGGGE
jgi:hypothetical protein